ncbi:unnamed protein product, partial [Iphiclides podalirius]
MRRSVALAAGAGRALVWGPRRVAVGAQPGSRRPAPLHCAAERTCAGAVRRHGRAAAASNRAPDAASAHAR